MQLVHHPADGDPVVLADAVRSADGFIARTLGLMGRRPLEPGEAMLFRFGDAGRRQIHTMFVRGAIDVVWVEAERVRAVETFDPWSIGTTHRADTVIEFPAGTAEGVAPDDILRVRRDSPAT